MRFPILETPAIEACDAADLIAACQRGESLRVDAPSWARTGGAFHERLERLDLDDWLARPAHTPRLPARRVDRLLVPDPFAEHPAQRPKITRKPRPAAAHALAPSFPDPAISRELERRELERLEAKMAKRAADLRQWRLTICERLGHWRVGRDSHCIRCLKEL